MTRERFPMKKTLLVLTILSSLLLVSGYYLFTFKDAIFSNFVIIILGAAMWILKIFAAIALSLGGVIIEAILHGLSGA